MLIQTLSNAERYAEEALTVAYRSCKVYFPKILVRRAHAGRVDHVLRPFIPRYAFVEEARDPRVVRSCPGVSNIVSYSDEVQHALDAIRARQITVRGPHGKKIDVIRLDKALDDGTDGFAQDDRVRVSTGPYSGYLGLFDAHSAKERVKILLQAMGRTFKVELGIREIEAV